ncbi:GntR family transcriptional regulator [Mycolicibacter icosiumassiliensis]|uniref:GntR family transcriptional regulator n=1 Tax=Mycolicibacter icosiumassiliensis TaxID=1792835 RepID=UPI000830FC79|nr:GntR family transcriptional regulator [Mycolicibacter icosiumassiliensis]
MSTPLATTDGIASSRADAVYLALRPELMNGEVAFGERLTEPKLAARFRCSRTPIREALARLCADGLIQREEYGFSPVRPNIARIRDLYEVRLTLEMAGIQRAIDNPDVVHDRHLLLEQQQFWESLRADPPAQEPGFVVVDEEFHVTLLKAAGNRELVNALLSANARIRHVRMYDFMVNNRIEVTISEHLAILEAVLAGRLEHARDLLRAHIGASLDVVFDRVSRAILAMSVAEEEKWTAR